MKETIRAFKAELFQALAHPTRIALLELLTAGEQPAGSFIEKLGLEQANVSQHLAVLRSKQIVIARRQGNQVWYSIRDPIICDILRLMRTYFHAQVKDTLQLLEETHESS